MIHSDQLENKAIKFCNVLITSFEQISNITFCLWKRTFTLKVSAIKILRCPETTQ